MTDKFVAVLMGSDSDWPVMEGAIEVLDSFRIRREVHVMSAHRTPDVTRTYVQEADRRGCRVFIAAAGMAAHLAGAVAANTLRPVVGVPLEGSALLGLDALLSTVQMPAGIPVATVAIGKAGARNAAYLAAQILATSDESLARMLSEERAEKARGVIDKDRLLQDRTGSQV